jgi:hypothetical protein
MFELLNPTKTTIRDVVVLSQKNRQPDDNPGAKVSVEQKLSNDMLAHFDGNLRAFAYTKNGGAAPGPKQATLEGVPAVSDTPNLTAIGSKVGWIHWDLELTGYEVVVDHGVDGKRSDLELVDCKLSGWRMKFEEGGTVVVRYNIESPDASEKAFGRLAKLKSTDVDVLVRPPEISQQDIEDAPKLTPAQLRAANAEGKTPEQALAEAVAAPPAETHEERMARGVPAWPFPDGDPRALANGKPASGPTARSEPAAPARKSAPTKYRDPDTGATWSGRGLKPMWLRVALERRGKTLADFEVAQQGATT